MKTRGLSLVSSCRATFLPLRHSYQGSFSQMPWTTSIHNCCKSSRYFATESKEKAQQKAESTTREELPKVILNKNTILADIDRILVRPGPPALEYILVNPPWFRNKIWGWIRGVTVHSTGNPYGHAAIRYTMPDGEQKVMNIVGSSSKQMVNFLKPEDYIFDFPQDFSEYGAEQGGIWKRTFVTIRVEQVPPEKIIAMDEFYKDLKNRSGGGDERVRQAGFSLFLSPLFNFLRKFFPGLVERGNCAVWTSRGMVKAGVIKSPSMWPKMIWIKTFLRYNLDFYVNEIGGYLPLNPSKKLEKKLRKAKENMNVVTYCGINHHLEPKGALVLPFHWLWHDIQVWWNLERFSNVIVKVPEGTRTAIISIQDPIWKRPVSSKDTHDGEKQDNGVS